MPRPGQPTTAEAPTAPAAPAGTTSPTRNEVNPEAIHIVVSRGREAAEAGLQQLEKSFAAPRPALNTTGGDPLEPEISMQDLEAMRETVDPNAEMPANLRALATMAEAHTYFRDRGEPEKAANAAKHYFLAERLASQTQGVLAMNALKEGNLEQACQLVNNACERFPTAHEILVTPGEGGLVNYSVKEAGKVLEQGTISANQMMELTGQIADGSLFMNSLVNFVESTTPPAKEMPSQALAVYGEAQSAAQQAFTAYEDSKVGGGEGDPDLLARAREAASAAVQAEQRALDLGLSSADLKGALERAAHRAAGQGATPQGNPAGGQMPAPASKQEYDALPSGTRYRHPNGEIKVKP